jgi:hypothetical protein
MKLLTLGLATATAFGFANSIPLATAAELQEPRALAIELGAPFHDHAVLQRGMTVPVWGWSKPGTKVTVEFAGQKATATAGDDDSKAIHLRCLQTDPTTPEHKEAWDAFYKSLEDQIAASEAAIATGGEAREISAPVPGNLSGNRDASWLFNGRLSPVVPYAIRGAIWNQGYANAGEGLPYYNNLHSLVRGWRIVWDKPELPVDFHQFYSAGMRNSGKEVNQPSIDPTAEMRLGTWLARDIPHTGMASQIDVSGGIHYIHKAVPDQRLALHALKNQYGKDVVTDGPMFKSYKVEGDTVIVTSPGVQSPRGVSYATGEVGFQPNLYNQALLPMTPFIHFDHKMVTSKTWPDAKLKIAGETIDPATVGKTYDYRKMPAVFLNRPEARNHS